MAELEPEVSVNVFGERLEQCSNAPVTGFFRNGACDTCAADVGSHTVCVVMTTEFLAFSKSRGNDLSTPRPEFGFPGLNDGDRWCLCAARWVEAYRAGKAPRIRLSSTHKRALEVAPFALLKEFAIDLA